MHLRTDPPFTCLRIVLPTDRKGIANMLSCNMKALHPCFILLLFCAPLFAHAQDDQAVNDSINDRDLLKTQPEFPGGYPAMYRWLRRKVHYPKQAFKNKIQGKVYVQFVVEKDGRIADVVVRRGCNAMLDAEAVRAIGKMPRWKPGRIDGTAVRVRFTIPVEFKIDDRRPGED